MNSMSIQMTEPRPLVKLDGEHSVWNNEGWKSMERTCIIAQSPSVHYFIITWLQVKYLDSNVPEVIDI